MVNQTPQRFQEFDWLRVLAFFILILFHTGMAFNTWGWHIKNEQQSELLSAVMIFSSQWRLALLFFISGVGTFFAFSNKDTRQYVKERTKRLFLPLVFGILVIVPPQIYIERLYRGQFTGGYWAFYPEFFNGIYPTGNFSWHHLWFVVYLIVAILITLPLLSWFKQPKGKVLLGKLTGFLNSPLTIHVFIIPILIIDICLTPFFPMNAQTLWGDWTRLSEMTLLFLMGYIYASDARLWDVLARTRLIHAALMLICYLLLYSLEWTPVSDFSLYDYSWPLYSTLRVFAAWLVIITILGYARVYLRRSNRILTYTNQAVYPYYILHQTITIIAVYFVITLPLGIAAKFLLVALATLVGTGLIYHVLIRPFAWSRFLFGLKP